jgi:hypothetical protein
MQMVLISAVFGHLKRHFCDSVEWGRTASKTIVRR